MLADDFNTTSPRIRLSMSVDIDRQAYMLGTNDIFGLWDGFSSR